MDKSLARSKILVADDTITERLILEKLLKKQGHDVVSAADGVAAIALFTSFQPDLILMDALMPGMDGFEATRQIKSLAGDAFIPIIFLTSLQDADSLARCLDAGGDDFLSKPYNNIILKAKIKAFTRMRNTHAMLQQQRDENAAHNRRLLREQEAAKRVFDKVAHPGCIDAENFKHILSPLAVFNGDIILAGLTPVGNHCFLMGDFTGHGLDAALGAMPLAQAFYSMLDKGFDQHDILTEINGKLHELLPTGVFCCAVVAELNYQTGTLHLWNGGLPDGLIYRPATGEIIHLPSRHLPLGIVNGAKFSNRCDVYDVEVGDRLYFMSDGILESENSQGEMFGEKRFVDVLNNNQSPQQLFSELTYAAHRFIAEESLSDDISLIEVTVLSPEHPVSCQPPPKNDGAIGPSRWSMQYSLQDQSLRDFNPLPMLLNVILQVPRLRPFSGQLYTVLSELYNNALEHGVLRLDSTMKDSAHGFSRYYQMRNEALQQLDQGHLNITFEYAGSVDSGELLVSMTDSGRGFNHAKMNKAAEQHYFGRGIKLVDSLCYSLQYYPPGNRVEAVFRWGNTQ